MNCCKTTTIEGNKREQLGAVPKSVFSLAVPKKCFFFEENVFSSGDRVFLFCLEAKNKSQVLRQVAFLGENVPVLSRGKSGASGG